MTSSGSISIWKEMNDNPPSTDHILLWRIKAAVLDVDRYCKFLDAAINLVYDAVRLQSSDFVVRKCLDAVDSTVIYIEAKISESHQASSLNGGPFHAEACNLQKEVKGIWKKNKSKVEDVHQLVAIYSENRQEVNSD